MTSHHPDPDLTLGELSRPDPAYTAGINNSAGSQPATTDSQVTVVHDPLLGPNPGTRQQQEEPSSDSKPTVVPYAPTPPTAPTPPSAPSEPEIYGPDRLFSRQAVVSDNVDRSLIPSPGVRLEQSQFPFMAAPLDTVSAMDFKDDLARAAGVVTPGVDDGPYIRYALDAMTRPREDGQGPSEYPSSSDSEKSQPSVPHYTHTTVSAPQPPEPPAKEVRFPQGNDPRYWWAVPSPSDKPTPTPTPPTALSPEDDLRERRERREQQRALEPPWDANMGLPPSLPSERPENSLPRALDHWQAESDEVVDPEKGFHGVGKAFKDFAPLTYKPRVLRPVSLTLLALLCLLMIAALIFCAVWSVSRVGFTPYAGTIYGGQYFLFRMLPPLLAITLLIYAQCVIATAFRVRPFSAMAADDRRERQDAVFLSLYPKSFLWPQLSGSWHVWLPTLNVWLLNFTIPLQSCLFTVILVDGTWTWATVQGVAWTLVALYVSFFLSVGVMFIDWQDRRTGMMKGWDIRTIADIIFLVSQSNSLPQYRGLETAATRGSMRQRIGGTAERLGFWSAPSIPEHGMWYGIGVATDENGLETEKPGSQAWDNRRPREKAGLIADPEVGDVSADPAVRYRYLPWCFRDAQIVVFAIACSALVVALLVVSFLDATDVRDGFLPRLSAAPTEGAFSAANFLYSFLPSLIGLLLFLVFQSLDLTLRILTPWGQLARPEGSRAETSLLLDYAACVPFGSTFKALRNKHWRVAFISLLSPLFALLPVLGGGVFMALTPSSGTVRMYPNLPAFAIILALLILYVVGVVCLIPYRQQFRLPHAVTCLAEIISFCCNEQLRSNPSFGFERVMGHRDIAGQLGIGLDWHRQGRWAFGAGRSDAGHLGIQHYSKFTVNPSKLRAYDKQVRGQLISAPLPQDSGSLFNKR
ncbi:hypothetical protein GGS23DRAFT_579998 [Durotheca rogersii]|uniref:uncharacterized protein n=1 Tax=Durotheca rogersii TaxID=419775 RepID=UPI0022211FDB|nr:uncharacterized protein GGS23DRAFT_579998 [Durotheca rogersii]KAI5860713.1 hypothetical protein GGS23DRAFT_579998 [Durotheca rogersii]